MMHPLQGLHPFSRFFQCEGGMEKISGKRVQRVQRVHGPERLETELRCVANLPACIREACRHFKAGRCTWSPPARERRTRGARVRLGKVNLR